MGGVSKRYGRDLGTARSQDPGRGGNRICLGRGWNGGSKAKAWREERRIITLELF